MCRYGKELEERELGPIRLYFLLSLALGFVAVIRTLPASWGNHSGSGREEERVAWSFEKFWRVLIVGRGKVVER